MDEKTTLLNCSAKEFLKQLNGMRVEICDYLNLTGLHNIMYKAIKAPEGISEEEKAKYIEKRSAERYDKVLSAAFGEHIDETYKILAKMDFSTTEEIEKLGITEVIGMVFSYFTHERTMPFFLTWRSSGLLRSDE